MEFLLSFGFRAKSKRNIKNTPTYGMILAVVLSACYIIITDGMYVWQIHVYQIVIMIATQKRLKTQHPIKSGSCRKTGLLVFVI